MSKSDEKNDEKPIWAGQPSVSVYYGIYGVLSVIIAAILLTIEIWLGQHMAIGHLIFPQRIRFIVDLYYPVEIITIVIIFLVFLTKAIRLAFLRAQNKYELRSDGLYMNLGIVNLENVYVSPMGFSDARVFRSLSSRLAKRGNIVIDTNDQRHFMLMSLKDPLEVQALIRRTMGRPTVRIE